MLDKKKNKTNLIVLQLKTFERRVDFIVVKLYEMFFKPLLNRLCLHTT